MGLRVGAVIFLFSAEMAAQGGMRDIILRVSVPFKKETKSPISYALRSNIWNLEIPLFILQ
jgi:hypothetical protein